MPPETHHAGLPRRVSLVLWLTLCLEMIGFGVILPVLPFHAERFGASPALVTLLVAVFSLAQLVASPLLGRLGDRIGRRRVLLVSLVGSCSSMLLLSVADSLWLLFVARAISGASGASMATAQAYVADHVPPDGRARAMGMLGSAVGVGFVLGPALGGLLSTPEQPALPFMVAAALAAIDLAIAVAWLPESRRASEPARTATRPPLAALMSAPVLINFGRFVAFAAMESSFALLLEARLSWGAWETGLLFAFIGAVIVVSQGALVGRVVARAGERSALRLGLSVLAIGLFAIALVRSGAGLAIAAALVALGNGLVAPALHAIVSRRAAADRQGLHLGVAASAASLGRVIGPLAAGVVFQSLGPGAPALLGGALVAFLVWAAKPPHVAPSSDPLARR